VLCDDKNWVIVGFFTPNYRPLATRFADSLRVQNLPYHLFAVERSGDWSRETMRKPDVVLDAMKVYPNKTLVFMDVDCIVRGSLDELVDSIVSADFSCYATVRMKGLRRTSQRFSLSSRVMLIRPTEGARNLMEQWKLACRERPNLHGAERNLVLGFARAYGMKFSPMLEIYAGREVPEAPPNAVIVHESVAFAHGKERSLSNQFDHLIAVVTRKVMKRPADKTARRSK
jgi:hypothetical protein